MNCPFRSPWHAMMRDQWSQSFIISFSENWSSEISWIKCFVWLRTSEALCICQHLSLDSNSLNNLWSQGLRSGLYIRTCLHKLHISLSKEILGMSSCMGSGVIIHPEQLTEACWIRMKCAHKISSSVNEFHVSFTVNGVSSLGHHHTQLSIPSKSKREHGFAEGFCFEQESKPCFLI